MQQGAKEKIPLQHTVFSPLIFALMLFPEAEEEPFITSNSRVLCFSSQLVIMKSEQSQSRTNRFSNVIISVHQIVTETQKNITNSPSPQTKQKSQIHFTHFQKAINTHCQATNHMPSNSVIIIKREIIIYDTRKRKTTCNISSQTN